MSEELKTYTINEICEIFKLSHITIRKEIKKGSIKAITVGGSIRITQQEIDRILKGE